MNYFQHELRFSVRVNVKFGIGASVKSRRGGQGFTQHKQSVRISKHFVNIRCI